MTQMLVGESFFSKITFFRKKPLQKKSTPPIIVKKFLQGQSDLKRKFCTYFYFLFICTLLEADSFNN